MANVSGIGVAVASLVPDFGDLILDLSSFSTMFTHSTIMYIPVHK